MAQDFANLSHGKVVLCADLVRSDYSGELQLEQARCNGQTFIKVDLEDRDPMSSDQAWVA